MARKQLTDLKVPFVLKGNFRQDDTPCTVAELATYVGVTERTIQRNIQKMQAENVLHSVGSKKAGCWGKSRMIKASHLKSKRGQVYLLPLT